jgi:hypothetical protein
MTGPFADRLFRIAFAAAGIYNLAFGLWAALWPHSFFELFAIPAPRYPGIWACLGMVVGLYGLLYLYAARNLDAAWPIIAVGLLGKVLGPLGMALSIGDDWPRRLGMLCVYNDLLWWLPFGLFLIRGTSLGRRLVAIAPWICVATHLLAVAMLAIVLRHGGLTQPDAALRGAYIASHSAAWTFGWFTWMIAATSLVAFYAWWGSRLAAAGVAIAAVVLAAVGMVCDLSGESLLALVLVERASAAGDPATAFGGIERAFTLLSAGAANGLYTVAGALLTWATPDLPGWVRTAMWSTWLAGAAMAIAAIAGSVPGMVLSTALLFPLLLSWMVWMAARGRRP